MKLSSRDWKGSLKLNKIMKFVICAEIIDVSGFFSGGGGGQNKDWAIIS